MTRTTIRSAIAALAIALAWGASWARPVAPATVSPGSPQQVVGIEQRCPTFSWGAVEGAAAYELAVFRAPSGPLAGQRIRPTAEALFTLSAPEVAVTIPAPASSWTPSVDQCLRAEESYVWFVRESGAFDAFAGEWSEGRLFRIVGPRGRAETAELEETADHGQGRGRGQGRGTGGIPAVLDELDELMRQIAINQAILTMRLDDLERQLEQHDIETAPCTPSRFRKGQCSPLDLETTFCFTVELGAELGAEYVVEPGLSVKLGASWYDGPKGNLDTNLELPAVLLVGPVPIPVPDFKLAAGFGGGASMEICLEPLKLLDDVSDPSLDGPEFATRLVEALEAKIQQIRTAAVDLVEQRNLEPGRFATALEKLQQIRGAGIETDGPLMLLKEGPFRELVDVLPVDDKVREILDDPSQLVMKMDPDERFQLCDRIRNMPNVGPGVTKLCDFVEGLPDLTQIVETIQNLPEEFVEKLCDETEICEAVQSLKCKANCRRTARQCKSDCGLFNFSCRNQCEADKDACIAGC